MDNLLQFKGFERGANEIWKVEFLYYLEFDEHPVQDKADTISLDEKN